MTISPQDLLAQAATSIGIATTNLSERWSREAIRFSYQDQQEVIFDGNALGSTPLLAWRISEDLAMLNAYLGDLGIPAPAGRCIQLTEEHSNRAELEAALAGFWEPGNVYRCRPAQASQGYGVASNLRSLEDLELHLDTFGDEFATWIVEEQAEGLDLELLVMGGQIKAAILRRPFSLQGDGLKTLEELIDAYNADADESNTIVIDGATRQLLRDQAVYLTEVVAISQSVQIKPAEAGLGSIADVTEQLHPSYAHWVAQISEAIDLQFYSISALSTSPSEDPAINAKVTGINASPNWIGFGSPTKGAEELAQDLLRSIFKIGFSAAR